MLIVAGKLYVHPQERDRWVAATTRSPGSPSRKELAAAPVLALPLAEASVKVRTGPPDDGHSPDAALGLWAGELPLATTWQQPIPDPALPPGIPIPAHIGSRVGTQAGHQAACPPVSPRPHPVWS